MQKVAIVTDGSCDLPIELIEKYNIFVVPFQVILNKKVYRLYGDFGTITKDEFYNLVKKNEGLPTTSLPSPKSFVDTFQAAAKTSKTIICITLSEQLSATLHIAKMALPYVEDLDITLIDSKVAASTLGALVIEAAKMAKARKKKEEIIERIEKLIPKARLAGIMDNIEATYRSGRISWGKKFLANTFRIKPIVSFEGGQIISPGSIRGGRNEVIKRMMHLAKIIPFHAETDTIFIWHVRCPKDAQMLRGKMNEYNPMKKDLIIQEAGPIIGTHVGFHALAYMYIGHFDEDWLMKMKE